MLISLMATQNIRTLSFIFDNKTDHILLLQIEAPISGFAIRFKPYSLLKHMSDDCLFIPDSRLKYLHLQQ